MSGIKQVCQATLKNVPIGTSAQEVQNGKDFYKFMFGNYPSLRRFFHGAEHFTTCDVQNSERFQRLGQSILLHLNLLVATVDDPQVFKALVREVINRHRGRGLDLDMWQTFLPVWLGFLSTKQTLKEEEKNAWTELWKLFVGEGVAHQKSIM